MRLIVIKAQLEFRPLFFIQGHPFDVILKRVPDVLN